MGRATQERKKAKIVKVLELQEQGITYKSMTDEQCKELLKYSKKTALYNLMTREGYTYDKEQGIFIKEQGISIIEQRQEIDGQMSIEDTITDNTTNDTTDTITDSTTEEYNKTITDTATTVEVIEDTEDYNKSITKTETSDTDATTTITIQDNFIEYLKQEDIQSKLFQLIQYADKIINNVKEEQIQKTITITIDTREKAIQKNLRMYESVAEDFKAFCNRHKEYKQQELVSQALREFMNKYN